MVTGKAAANILATAYKAEGGVNLAHTRIREVRTEAKIMHQSKREEGDPCMSNSLSLWELEDAIRKLKQKKAPGVTNEMLMHLGQAAKRTLLAI